MKKRTSLLTNTDADIVIFSDRDAEVLTDSGGTKAALKAALATEARIVVPEWCGIDGRDANDIYLHGFTWSRESYPGPDILESCVKFATPCRSPAFMSLLAACGITTDDLAPQSDGYGPAIAERAGAGRGDGSRDEERRRQQQEENRRLQESDAGAMIPSRLSLEEMVDRCILVADGKRVAYVTEDRSLFIKYSDFVALTAESKTEIERERGTKIEKELLQTANLWLNDTRRLSVMVPTFHAGARIITADPEWRRAVNTWRPIKRWPVKADISPFLDQVAFLFPDDGEREAFLDWLAHIEQKPGELPHYGWLHIAKNTGTGRNWVASVLARAFRGYVAPNVDLAALLDSQFNDELSGRVLAIVDEVQEGASEGNYRHAERLKSMVNVEKRPVNIKYGGKHLEHNACRWLVFSNHENALPLTDKDRRFRVMVHEAPPRPPEVYENLYALLEKPEFINAVGMFLRQRDISRFKPGERPPLNAAKLAAIAASKPMSTQNAEEIVACWPADIITYKHVAALVTGDPGVCQQRCPFFHAASLVFSGSA